jgi:hypothetical protein
MELRHFAYKIFRDWDVELAEQQTEQAFVAGKKDMFMLAHGPVYLKFAKRERKDT